MSSLNRGSVTAKTLRPGFDLPDTNRLGNSRVAPAISHGGSLHFPTNSPKTLGESLRRTAVTSDKNIVSIQPDGSEIAQSYSELWDEAKKVSSGLKKLGLRPGDKVIFQFESNHDFISAFWGCVFGGFVPVPISPAATYEQNNSAVSKLQNAWTLLDEPLVLTTESLAKSVRSVSTLFNLKTFRVETIERLRQSDSIEEMHESKPDDLALLMLTSGSTGIPKAVMLSHRNLLSRSAGTVQMNGFCADDISFSWMPMDHVGSLIYFHLRDVYTGCQQINAPAKLILQNPIRWLEWLDQYKATVTFAPNFAFGLVNERADEIARRNWDLSSLRLVLNGGEAVVARTARKFVQLLAPHGLRGDAMHPAWGMSETSSGVTYGDRFSLDTTSNDDSFVEVGAPIPGVSLRIVDGENNVVPEGEIGRLQITGATLMSGYFKKPDPNHEIFTEDGWFITGDLGLLRDGRLTITGREKDVIILNGVNYYSHEIEAAVEGIPGIELSYTAACGVRDPVTRAEKLAIFFNSSLDEAERLVKEIRAKVVRAFGINPEHVLHVSKDQIPKTEIGKIQRTKLKEQFEAGNFDEPGISQIENLIDGAEVPSFVTGIKDGPMALADGGPLFIADDEPKTLGEALIRTATKFPASGIKVVETNRESFLSYPDLLDHAKRILNGLRQQGLKPKDSVILQIDSLAHHFASFWACVLGGITPVTVAIAPSYSDKNGIVNKLHNVWNLLDHPVILTGKALAKSVGNVSKLFSGDPLRVVVVEELLQEAPAKSTHPAMPGDVVFFQLTSGSTGIPKCIQETHRSLISHIHSSQQFNHYSSNDITLNWLSMDHVVPILTFHLKDVYLGCKQIHAKSETVLTNPLRWLDLIQENRVTHTWAPNFGFKLVAEALAQAGEREWDLSSVKFFMNAGEQVTMPVVHDFLRGVEPFGVPSQAMQPAFGMAEVCTCMTYANHFTEKSGVRRFWKSSLNGVLQETKVVNGSSVGFVSLGPPAPGVQIRITDHQNNLLPEGVIGRFQIKGDVVTPGYLKNEEANRDSFVGDGWFNSGDIGFILNGELYLTGREKEMLNIRGAKFYCYEIEDVVNQIPEVEPTFVATCGIASSETGSETLAVLFVPRKQSNAQTTIQTIRNRVSANLGISPDYIVPVAKKDFPKTTSGKIQRMQFKKMLEAGSYQNYRVNRKAISRELEVQTETEKELCQIWRDVLRATFVSKDSNFFELGGDSLRAFQVLSRVREKFGVEIPLHALFESASTIAAMAQWIDTHEKTSSLPPIQSAPRDEPLLLSFPQQRLWLLDQMEGSSTLYTVARCVWLNGDLDKNALRHSLDKIISRHEILRTTFKLSGETPVQIVHPAKEIALPVIESAFSKDEAIKLAIAETQKPFDLKNGPLFRAALFRCGDQHLLLLTFHQIIVDGWSIGLFLEELSQIYNAFRSGENAPPPPLQIQFADFAQWQRRWMTGERITSQLDYWKKQLAGPRPILKLPIDHPRPQKDTFRGAAETLVLPKALFDEVKKFNQREGTTLFMTLLAVYQMLLRHYAKEDDILVGSPVGGRPRLETEKLIGFFANTVVLRTRFEKQFTVRELLAQVRDNAVAAYANADLPFERLVQTLQPDRHQQNAGLFQVWFGPIDSMPSVPIGGSTAEVTNLPITPSQFDLTLLVAEKPQEAVCLFEYKTDLFERKTIQKIARDYEWLLKEFIAHPEMEIAAFDEKLRQRDSAREQEQLKKSRTDTQINFPQNDSVLALVDKHVRSARDEVSVVCGAQSLTYGELDLRANQIANLLRKNGVGPEIAVGLFVERSIEMIVGILAILKAGGAYVPLDPGYPQERLSFVLGEIESPVILTQSKFLAKIPSGAKTICIDMDDEISRESSEAPLPDFSAENLAYVIFTSGSTGKPKGVLVTHKTLLHSTQARLAFYKEPVENYLLISSFAFDSSIAGIFWTLARGGTLTLPQEGRHQDPLELVRLMLQHRVSHFLSLPSLYSLILQQSEPAQLASLRCVIVAGESCSQELVKCHYRLLPNTALFNEYGPTEGTVWSTAIQLRPDEPVTIGRPIANAQIHILDEHLEPVPTGKTGEIFIGGAGIVRGYLKRLELTREKFIADKFSKDPNARLYRTGDLARSLPDGRIEFLGRVDHQIKLRGHRIELEEIEAALKQNANVHDAAVVAREEKLVAYVVARNHQNIETHAMREFLEKQLPNYMIPAAFIVLPSLPQTPNGKVDRNALPAAEPASQIPRTAFVEPRTPIEIKLANIWSGVLGVEKVGVHDDFFELGGHSLLAIQIMARVRDAFQIEIPLPAIFEAKNVATLSETIVQLLAQADTDGELAHLLSELETLTDEEARELLEQNQQAAGTL